MALNVQRFIDNAIEEIRRDVKGRAIIGLSGGVDSSVCAVLAHRALGDRLVPVYVDSGLMRQFESDRIEQLFQNIGLVRINAQDRFIDALKGVTDPEKKRKIVGETFIRIFEEEAARIGGDCLIQGTIYPDRIESEGGIKAHHNVGGLPSSMDFKSIIEPLRDLYKDEVREVARALGLPQEISERMPYPGRPGSAHPGRGHIREAGCGAQGQFYRRGGGHAALPLAGLCCTAGKGHRRQGRRAGLRLDSGSTLCDIERRHDRRCDGDPMGQTEANLQPYHRRNSHCGQSGLRPDAQAARDHRV